MTSAYEGKQTQEIIFPIGGIGTGSIGLAGDGRLVDWNIFNRPNLGSANKFSAIFVKAMRGEEVLDTRVLEGDLLTALSGGETTDILQGNGGWGFGFGPYRGTMAGLPHFRKWQFIANFPFASIEFRDAKFPGIVTLTAWNPFIPSDAKNSSLPVANFKVEFRNNTADNIEYSVFFALNNPLPRDSAVNEYIEKDQTLLLRTTKRPSDDIHYGNLSLSTTNQEISYQRYWYRSDWFDSLIMLWRDITNHKRLPDRNYAEPQVALENQPKELRFDGEDVATLATHTSVNTGEVGIANFSLGWYFPNVENYWHPAATGKNQWKNYYATVFDSALAVTNYMKANESKLYLETTQFVDDLTATSLPADCIEAVQDNIAILNTSTVLRLEGGEFYGFEGIGMHEGICEGSCTHVWNYAYALPFLFPELERSMREVDYRYNLAPSGEMQFRLMLPLGREPDNFRPCVDGQMGGIIKTYQDYKLSGDTEWLKRTWPLAKKALEFAWSPENTDKWDPDQSGVITGRQHNTLDMELFGPNSWLEGFYLGALAAASKICEVVGDPDGEKYRDMLKRGQVYVKDNLFVNQHFIQKVDLTDKSLLEAYTDPRDQQIWHKSIVDAYWNDEVDEIKYQIAEGSEIDQVLAQWHANLAGLDEIFDESQLRAALQTMYEQNFKHGMRDTPAFGRLYAINDESAVQICAWDPSWPKPVIPITYADESFTGMEYALAGLMIQTGMVQQGFDIVQAIRERFDGEKRNPFDEFECGNEYARAMASYSLIPAISGFAYDLSLGKLGFKPQTTASSFKSFWSVDGAWGTIHLEEGAITLKVTYGEIRLSEIDFRDRVTCSIEDVAVDELPVDFEITREAVMLKTPITMNAGSTISFTKKG